MLPPHSSLEEDKRRRNRPRRTFPSNLEPVRSATRGPCLIPYEPALIVSIHSIDLSFSTPMVDVRRPCSMPSMLLSYPSTSNYTLPPLSPTRQSARSERDSVRVSARAGTDSWADWLRTGAAVKSSQTASPRTMSGTHINPLLAPPGDVLQYKSVPAAKQSTQASHTSLGTVAAAQYTSKAPPPRDTQNPPSRPRSPTVHRDGAGSREHGRGRAAENNGIASYLQIPASINTSKGSLADFAAQV